MTISQAVLYRLFVGTGTTRRWYRPRLAGFFVALLLVSLFVYRAVPQGLVTILQLSPSYTWALLYVIVSGAVTVLFVLLNGYQMSFMLKLAPLALLPITPRQAKRLHALAYIPIALLCLSIVAPAILQLFSGQFVLGLLVAPAAIIWNVLVGLSATNMARLVFALPAVVCAQAIMGNGGNAYVVATILLAVGQLITTGLLIMAPLKRYETHSSSVPEARQLDVVYQQLVRALRTKRFVAAVGFIVAVLAGLAYYIHHTASLPFDAVVVASLLLAGTLAQEARSLSRRTYPTELVLFGAMGRWLGGGWLVGASVLGVIIVALLVLGRIVFSGSLSVGDGHVIAVGAALLGVGFLASSIAVPQKNDIIAQLGSVMLYAFGAWGAMRLIGKDRYSILSASLLTVTSLAICVGIEARRWRKTIKGDYGELLHTKAQ